MLCDIIVRQFRVIFRVIFFYIKNNIELLKSQYNNKWILTNIT